MDRVRVGHPLVALLIGALSLGLVGTVHGAQAAVADRGDFIQHYDTLYNHLVIEKKGTVVEMRSMSRRQLYRESAIDLNDPERLLVPYTQTLFAGTIFRPDPDKVLMIGLGGGGFNRVFNRVYDRSLLRTVEIDKRVKELAAEHMAFREGERNQVVIMDGRMFVKRNRNREKYDWIILDAYKGNSVPPHLKTQEFYREVSLCLNSGGIVIINLQGDSMLFDFDVATLASSFPQVLYFRVPKSPNVVAVAAASGSPDLRKTVAAFNRRSVPDVLAQRVDFKTILGGQFDPEISKEARVMTDDFAPADYYRVIERRR